MPVAHDEAFAACPIGLALVSTSESDAPFGCLEEVNDAFCRLAGQPRAALLREGLGLLVGPGEEEALRAALAAPMSHPREVEWAARRADGQEAWLRLRLAPLPSGAGLVLALTDITAQRAMVTGLEAACRQAKVASEAKSCFLANMSHEIRTPLNGIIGMTTLLAKGELTEEQRGFAASVLRSADLLMVVINDILDITRLEAGQLDLECVPFALAEALEGVMELAAARGAEKGLEVLLDLPQELRQAYLGDPTRLSQVLLNLTGNAVKFTAAGYVLVTVRATPEGLRFTVADTGPGIPAAALPRLFRKFSQADSSITRRFGGSGLGLAICSQIVGLMGGRIGVESTEGQGATFWFEVPLDRADRSPDHVAEARLLGRRALVVDDLALNRAIFTRQLEELGLVAEAAASGTEALEMMRRAGERGIAYDVVLVDHMMPDCSGVALAQRLRGEWAAPARGLVLASSAGEVLGPAERELFVAVLSKPVRQAALVRALGLALSGSATPVVTLKPAADGGIRPEMAGRLLLVEDNAVNREVARRMLEQAGFEVLLAADGEAGVFAAATAGEALDAILMDIELPDMDGLEAMRRIRALPGRIARLPVIALTAHAMAGTREQLLRAGADGYLAKPFRADSLRDAVLAALHAKRAVARAEAEPDWDEAIRAELDALPLEVREELQDAFGRELPGLLGRMEAARETGDAGAMRAAAHALAGCAASYGARRVAALARVAEHAAGKENLFTANAVLIALRPLCARLAERPLIMGLAVEPLPQALGGRL